MNDPINANTNKSNKRNLIIIGAIVIVFVCICGGLTVAGVYFIGQQEQEKEKYAELVTVCERNGGVATASGYSQGSSTHPIVIMEHDGSEFDQQLIGYPEAWKPADVASTQLVACLDELENIMLESCDYYDTDSEGNLVGEASYVERYRYEQKIALYDARSGELLAKDKFVGGIPDECSDEVFFEADGEIIVEQGSAISDELIAEWLTPYVER